MPPLTGFDYVVLTLVGLFLLVGLARGLVTEALSLAAWVAAAIAVRLFHQPVTGILAPNTGGEASAAILAFLLLFFGTLLVGRLLAATVGRASRESLLGPFDRVAGAGFGAAKGAILATVLFMLVQFTTGYFDPRRESPEWLTRSASAPFLTLAAATMIDWMEEAKKVEFPTFSLPEGHPPIPPGMAPPRPGHGRPQAEQGYLPEDNRRLQELIEKGEAVDL
ncbi:MAG: CvpA family protein [Sphingomonadaceae bacterium]